MYSSTTRRCELLLPFQARWFAFLDVNDDSALPKVLPGAAYNRNRDLATGCR